MPQPLLHLIYSITRYLQPFISYLPDGAKSRSQCKPRSLCATLNLKFPLLYKSVQAKSDDCVSCETLILIVAN